MMVNCGQTRDSSELYSSYLTPDFIDEMCNNLSYYPVSNPSNALKILENWENYIEFRRYYLNKISEDCEEISNVSVLNSYMITKEMYTSNKDTYNKDLLDGIADFAKGEQILLAKNVNGAESFPLIRVNIEKNKKEIFQDKISSFQNVKSKYEVKLQRFTHDTMGLANVKPVYDKKGEKQKNFNSYLLGERYLFTYVDIEPDCTELEQLYEDKLQKELKEIDNKYKGIIENELAHFMADEKPKVEYNYKNQYLNFVNELTNSLESDVLNNNDKEIKRLYNEEIKNITDKYNKDIKKLQENNNSKKDKKKKKSNDKVEVKIKDLELKKQEEINKISLKDLYVKRNEELIKKKEQSINILIKTELDNKESQKRNELTIQYSDDKKQEEDEIKFSLMQELENKKAQKIENETIRRYQIYFRPDSLDDKASDIEKDIQKYGSKYLIFDNKAEKAKIDRQEKALNSLKKGYVKNPFLASYLFSPKSLKQSNLIELKDPDWCLESLNDSQKQAVKKALASESIFLLQGPPGTGKTQVIAEITAQLAKRGKKVLISSETHKAIDNVFDRLPKIPEIRPLRLIPSVNGKVSNYSPENLVDNLYLNIVGKLKKTINRFENFEETKKIFDEQMIELQNDHYRILKLKQENSQINNEINSLSNDINKDKSSIEDLRNLLKIVNNKIDEFERTKKKIEQLNFSTDDVIADYIETFKDKVMTLLESSKCLEKVKLTSLHDLYFIDIKEIYDEIHQILSNEDSAKLSYEQEMIRKKLHKLQDPITCEPPSEDSPNYSEYKKLQSELIEIIKIKSSNDNTSDISSSKVKEIFPDIINDKNLLKELPLEIFRFKNEIKNIINEIVETINNDLVQNNNEQQNIELQINDIQIEINSKRSRYEELKSNRSVEEYDNLNAKLKQKINKFFRDFDIIREYDSNDFDEAFSIIQEEWSFIKLNGNNTDENEIKIYKEICKYLEQEDILEEDRQAYTRELFDNANVFGITCTSRDKFTKTQLAELEKYGINSIDIRSQGIDVVIVDEVSKSSFLDLLIPILYGKTIILVGDHRQLPPMYDLRHLRQADFEGLDGSIINKEKNDEYTALYEECFFKTLYEKIPNDFKIMLDKQYRCHSHIMKVFNHFYGGNQFGLKVGKKQQDDEKQHNLTVRINGNTIIEPKYHVYFVDCDQYESSAYEGSTSKINEQEAQVAMELLKELNNASIEAIKAGKINYNKNKKIDERLSAGIICTYSDQAKIIRNKKKNKKFEGFSEKSDEKLIISTVDDFQGDERDIIIVSMVRNPRNKEKSNADFIKKFERINVALSRARKLLIIIGSKKYLSEAGIIDLPDLNGDHLLDKNNFPVYKEIINTISSVGKLLSANDIIQGE